MDKEIIEFEHQEKIKEYLQELKEIVNNINLETKELSFNNIEKMKKQKDNLQKIETIGHLIRNCSSIKLASPDGTRLTII